MQRLFLFSASTSCPGIRGHFCPAAFLLCTLFSKTTAQHLSPGLCSHVTLLIRPSSPPTSSHFCFMVFHTFKQFSQTSMSVYVYAAHTYTHTHSEVNTEKGNTNKMMNPGDSINLSADLNIFRIKNLREKLDRPAWVAFL